MNIPILRLPYTDKDIAEIQDGIARVLRSNVLTKGDTVAQFEQEWARYCGVKYAVATTSGTSALEIIFRSLGVEGKSVIIPSNTFIATAVAVIRAGGKVILADCERETLQLSLKSAMDAKRDDTVAVCLVHIGGYITPHLAEFQYWTKREGIHLVEDACHSHSASYDGHKAGSLGIAGAFSFFPTKVLCTGEGGMITTNSEDIHRECISLRNQGRRADDPQVHYQLGYNWRMDEIRAVLGLQQVRKADAIVGERRKIAGMYDYRICHSKELYNHLRPVHIDHSAHYKYIVLMEEDNRDAIRKAMEAKGIAMPGLVYEVPLHKQPAILDLWKQGGAKWGWYHPSRTDGSDGGYTYPTLVHYDELPNTDWVADHHLCLPLHLGMTEEEVDYVVESLKEVLG